MKRNLFVAIAAASGAAFLTFGAAFAAGLPGEPLFKQHCAACHPDGGNIINPQKTLHLKDRQANKINKAEDIVKTMRRPGPGMTVFDAKTIADKDARRIADYIIKTYGK